MSEIQSPSIGRTVFYVLTDGPHRGEVRPAAITRVWSADYDDPQPGMCNLQVFRDTDEDFPDGVRTPNGSVGRTSVCYAEAGSGEDEANVHGTWHWPQVVPAPEPAETK